MRQKLVKAIRRSARALFPDRPYAEYTEVKANIGYDKLKHLPSDRVHPMMIVLTDNCIKKIVKDTKRHLKYGR